MMIRVSKQQLIIIVLLLAIATAGYCVSVFSIDSQGFYEADIEIKDIQKDTIVPLRLDPNTYFLKIKYFTDKDTRLEPVVSYGAQALKPYREKVRPSYLKHYFKVEEGMAGRISSRLCAGVDRLARFRYVI